MSLGPKLFIFAFAMICSRPFSHSLPLTPQHQHMTVSVSRPSLRNHALKSTRLDVVQCPEEMAFWILQTLHVPSFLIARREVGVDQLD